MREEYYDTYYDEEHGEERVVVDGQLYRVRHTKVGAPETDRFTATGSGSTSWTPIDEAGNKVRVKRRWNDPRYVEGRISFLRENFGCVGLLEEMGREAYPGAALDVLRNHLRDLHEDLAALDRLWREGELERLDRPLEERLARLEESRGLTAGDLRKGRRSLDERYLDLRRTIVDLSSVMERYGIEVPDTIAEANAGEATNAGARAGSR